MNFLAVFYWSLSDNKSPRVSRVLHSILVDFSNSEVWMVSIFTLISNSSIPFSKHLGTVTEPISTLSPQRIYKVKRASNVSQKTMKETKATV